MEGLRIAVTGARKARELARALEGGGAAVIWVPAPNGAAGRHAEADLTPRRLLAAAVDGDLDVVTATGAAAVRALVAVASGLGREDALVAALRDRVAVAALGPRTAAAFEDAGIPVDVMPNRATTGALLAAVGRWGTRRAAGLPATVGPGLGRVELLPSARAARAGGRLVRFGDREFAVLAAIVRRPEVVSRFDVIAREAYGGPADPARIKHPVSRVRRKLGAAAAALETVRGVGYRYSPSAVAHDPLGTWIATAPPLPQ